MISPVTNPGIIVFSPKGDCWICCLILASYSGSWGLDPAKINWNSNPVFKTFSKAGIKISSPFLGSIRDKNKIIGIFGFMSKWDKIAWGVWVNSGKVTPKGMTKSLVLTPNRSDILASSWLVKWIAAAPAILGRSNNAA